MKAERLALSFGAGYEANIKIVGSVLLLVVFVMLQAVSGQTSPEFQKAVAEKEYTNALSLLPDNSKNLAWRCFLLFRLKRDAEAVECAQTALVRKDVDEGVVNRVVMELAHEAKPEVAKDIISNFNKNTGNTNAFVKVMLAFTDYRSGDTNSLRSLADEFAKTGIENPMLAVILYEELVLPAYRRQDYSNALADFNYVYKADPQKRLDRDYMIEWAVISNDAGNYTAALAKLDEVERQYGSTLDATRKAWIADLRGDIYTSIKDYPAALQQYNSLSNQMARGNAMAKTFFEADAHEIKEAKRAIVDSNIPSEKQSSKRRVFLLIFLFVMIVPLAIMAIRMFRKSGALLGTAVLAVGSVQLFGAGNITNIEQQFGRIRIPTNLDLFVTLPGSAGKRISHVSTSCGCTTAEVEKGDVVATNQQIAVHVNVAGHAFGPTLREVNISMEDKSEYIVHVFYEYYPEPFCEPLALVFTASKKSRDLSIFFPSDPDVRLIDLPGVQKAFTLSKITYDKNIITLTVSAATDDLASQKEGKLELKTTSKQNPKIDIPYLLSIDAK